MNEWQPIETVPSDRFVLLFCDDEPRWAGNMEVGKWYGEDAGGFWSCGGPNGGGELGNAFTHWMDLPEDPPVGKYIPDRSQPSVG